jgi:hypothetical protein
MSWLWCGGEAMKREKLITLADTFRTILRSWYPKRPALADEIQSKDYFRSPFDKSIGWRLDPEVQAADFAYAELKDAIVSQSIRLYGRRDGNLLSADIDPTEIVRSGILIFDNALEVYQLSTSSSPFRILPTYRNVHCYAAEIDALIGTAAAAPEHPAPLSKEEAVKRAIAGCFPNGIIPGDILSPSLCRKLGDWLKNYLPNMATISDSTMLRVAGRKKDLKANRAK